MVSKRIYHGSDDHYCYYRPNCLVCYLRLSYYLLLSKLRYSLGLDKTKEWLDP